MSKAPQAVSVGTGKMSNSRSRRNLPRRTLMLRRVMARRGMACRGLTTALLVAGSVILAACTVGSLGDHLPSAAGGLPENAPARPATPAAYPAVHDMPPPRDEKVLTVEEQRKVEDELVAMRNRAATGIGPTGKPSTTASKPTATPRKPAASAEKSVAAEKPASGNEKPAAGTEKP